MKLSLNDLPNKWRSSDPPDGLSDDRYAGYVDATIVHADELEAALAASGTEPRCGNGEPHEPHDYYLKCPNMCADFCPGASGTEPTREQIRTAIFESINGRMSTTSGDMYDRAIDAVLALFRVEAKP